MLLFFYKICNHDKKCRFISLLIGESTARLGRKFKLDES